jgi:beta-fructofuranosidase
VDAPHDLARLTSNGDRPRLHLTPPTGWMNDPNGMLFLDGRLHMFYQYEPDAPRWGRMRWGHAVSDDMLHWQHEPIALEPDASGPDSAGCWSGCLVLDDAGTPTIFYTGVVKERIRRASIGMATSTDGLRTWTKDHDGPIIRRPPTGIRPDRFRDPFVWRDEVGWAMLVGAGTTNGRGMVLLYRSDDLRTWRYAGPFLSTDAAIAEDPQLAVDDIDSPCWECPQLVRLDGVDVLIISVVDRSLRTRPAHVVAFTGRMVDDRFLVRRTERLGLGPDFYAPATVRAPDGRSLLFGWIPEDPPGKGSTRTWAGCLSLPRVVSVDDEAHVRISIAREVDRAGSSAERIRDVRVDDGEVWRRVIHGGGMELRAAIIPEDVASIRIDVSGENGPVAEVRFDPRERRLTATRMGRVAVAGRDPHGTTILPPTADGHLRLRVVLDGSSLELVADDRVTATARLPGIAGQDRTIALTAIGGSFHLADLEISTLPGTTLRAPD